MKFTYRWLKEHLDIDMSPAEVATRLTLAGLEVGKVLDLGQGLEQVQVGLLTAVDPHPNAERLTVCQVRIGNEQIQVVCGATNHRPGDKVAVARVGARLPNGMEIAQSLIRGQSSAGMLCSLSELGLASTAEGILILPPTAPEGGPIAPLLGRHDHLFEVDLTPNRGDCLSVRGIARELAALTGRHVRQQNFELTEDASVGENHPITMRIDDGAACSLYAGRVIAGVRIGPSPVWLRQRLEAVGLRSINNIVDVTNYLMLDLGQPLHAFDLARLAPPLVVRGAWESETITTLDGMQRTLTPGMTLIADSRRPLALAGIMGGEESGVVATTTAIFLESACFDPVRTARTGRTLGLLSDSRYRFERGVDPEGVRPALDRATRLILDLAGGRAGPGFLVNAGTSHAPPPIPFRHGRAMQLAGITLPPKDVHDMLTRLGCQLIPTQSGSEPPSKNVHDMLGSESPSKNVHDMLTRLETLINQKQPWVPSQPHPSPVGAEPLATPAPTDSVVFYQPPSYRHDLRREEDLIEEIVRLHGYDRVPARLPTGPISLPAADPLTTLMGRSRRILVGLGYLETINFAFVSATQLALYTPEQSPLPLLNPISEEQGVMRTLLAPGLVETARRNLSRGHSRLRLCEIGRIFQPGAAGSVTESERIGGLLCGSATGRNWHTPPRSCDFFDLKGDVIALLAGLDLSDSTYRPGGPSFLHPGRKAEIVFQETTLGWLGEMHPALQERLDIPQPLFLFELDLERVLQQPISSAHSVSISRFPSVARDFAFIVNVQLPADDLMQAIRQCVPDLIRSVTLFDLYTGDRLPAGRKSLGVEVIFQAEDRTLTEETIQGLADTIITTMQGKFAAAIPGLKS
ncbi:MAG: phenylalanine--tRNA ligase subunit beta [Magnetococcus sp. DMHC-1]|nr:phenylalanine--tRNA ligase subunit beta [Magnetococcales bacterium]